MERRNGRPITMSLQLLIHKNKVQLQISDSYERGTLFVYFFRLLFSLRSFVRGLVHRKMKIQSSSIHPHVIPDSRFFFFNGTQRIYLAECPKLLFCQSMKNEKVCPMLRKGQSTINVSHKTLYTKSSMAALCGKQSLD